MRALFDDGTEIGNPRSSNKSFLPAVLQALLDIHLLVLQERNLKDYTESRYKHVVDLTQYPRNNRGRGETRDNALPTLTTNSGKLYSKADSSYIVTCVFFFLIAIH